MEALRLQKKRHTINTKAAYVFHPPLHSSHIKLPIGALLPRKRRRFALLVYYSP